MKEEIFEFWKSLKLKLEEDDFLYMIQESEYLKSDEKEELIKRFNLVEEKR